MTESIRRLPECNHRNCIIESGDDSIVLKATRPVWEKYGNCENIVITNCILHSRDSALKIGTETWGTSERDIRRLCCPGLFPCGGNLGA